MATDVSGLDPITVSLRDYIDGSHVAHEGTHARERETTDRILNEQNKYSETVIGDHFRSHDKEHASVGLAFANAEKTALAYQEYHEKTRLQEREAVKVALQAVRELASIHALSHNKEHDSHELVHAREREADALARVEIDQRLLEAAGQRNQLREQANTFMSRTEITSIIERLGIAIEAQTKAADNAHNRMDSINSERIINLQSQIDKLNIYNASNAGASQRTTYLIGASFTFITIVIAIVGIYLSSKGN